MSIRKYVASHSYTSLCSVKFDSLLQEHETNESRNVNSNELDNETASADNDVEASELRFIQSLLSQLNIDGLKNDGVLKDAVGQSGEASNVSSAEEKTSEKTGALETTGDGNSVGRSGAENSYDAKRRNLLEYISKMLSGDTNRRLDFEDNGDGIPDLADIDNPRSNDYNQDQVVDFRANTRFMGTIVDTKGRTGNFGE